MSRPKVTEPGDKSQQFFQAEINDFQQYLTSSAQAGGSPAGCSHHCTLTTADVCRLWAMRGSAADSDGGL